MIKLRIDVDYPYTSRARSFLYVALRVKNHKGKDYLKNARIIAEMINESPKNVKAYWFFTPYTIPGRRLLSLLDSNKHEIALHVANKPLNELKNLENETGRKVQYYTIHGTERVFSRVLWGRRLNQSQADIPGDFPLISFHNFTTMSLDRERYLRGYDQVVRQTQNWVEHDVVMSLHPEWLFEKREKTQRGPFYDVLKTILDVDHDLETMSIRQILGVKIARDFREYYKGIVPTEAFLSKLQLRDIDIFTFIERRWCCPINNPPSNWLKTTDNIGLLEIKDYQTWWNAIGKKTRNMVRKAEKDGVVVSIILQNEELARGIWEIYNETPIRQGRAFPHYGEPLDHLTRVMYQEKNSTYIAAHFQGKIIGFIQITHGDYLAIISNILSMQKHLDKGVNNALLAKAVQVCASKGEKYLMYGRIGNHPSLDKFKENNGFVMYPVSRYFIPLTFKGEVAIKLRLNRELKDVLPDWVKYPLLPAVNWASRTKTKAKLLLKKYESK